MTRAICRRLGTQVLRWSHSGALESVEAVSTRAPAALSSVPLGPVVRRPRSLWPTAAVRTILELSAFRSLFPVPATRKARCCANAGAERPKPLRGPRCSYTEWRRRWVKCLSSLKTGATPTTTWQFASAPRPTTCRGTFAGAVSHHWWPASTSVRRRQTSRSKRTSVYLRTLPRAGTDLPVLRSRQHLL
jgi:hypothetical protein